MDRMRETERGGEGEGGGEGTLGKEKDNYNGSWNLSPNSCPA